jgi:6-phosphogluconolactonase
VTFTFTAIARSPLVVITVAGADKRDALARIRAGEDLPAARVRAKRVLWLVDPAALGDEVGGA